MAEYRVHRPSPTGAAEALRSGSMADWEVWRQDDNGQRSSVAAYPDRVHALACVLVFQAGQGIRGPGTPASSAYEVVGPPEPAVVTNRDLYLRLLALGEHLTADRAGAAGLPLRTLGGQSATRRG